MWCGERALILKYEMAICESISVKFFAGPFMNGRALFFFPLDCVSFFSRTVADAVLIRLLDNLG